MKTTAAVILILGLIFFGCKKDETSPGPTAPSPPTSTRSCSAKVNGNLVQADSARGYLHIDTSFGNPIRVFFIQAFCDTHVIMPGFGDILNSTSLVVQSYDSIGPVSFPLLQYMTMNDTINEYNDIGSHLDFSFVDNINKKISGHFNGKIVADVSGDTVVITNGVFYDLPFEIW